MLFSGLNAFESTALLKKCSVTFQKSGARNCPLGSIGNLKISNVLLGMYVKFLLRPQHSG